MLVEIKYTVGKLNPQTGLGAAQRGVFVSLGGDRDPLYSHFIHLPAAGVQQFLAPQGCSDL